MKNSSASPPSPANWASDRRKLSATSHIPIAHLIRDEWRGCTTKRSFDTEWEATCASARAREQSGHHNIAEYKCKYCPLWHIGHHGKTHLRERYFCPVERRYIGNVTSFQAHIRWHEENRNCAARFIARMRYSLERQQSS